MKSRPESTVREAVSTRIARLEWLDWEHNKGRARIEGTDELVECSFCYMGQHWIWNMDAYPEENAASHSAFAFCSNDRVILVEKARDEKNGKRVDYVAVAVMAQDGAEIIKRKAWPLYRLGHEALVYKATYSAWADQPAGFPFINTTTRELINPYTDQQGNARALGTRNGTGNHRLVICREAGQGPGNDTAFVAHAAHEFSETEENIPYRPDMLLQTRPNWRGRIIGMSINDELLIDNIPVVKIGTIENDDFQSSDKAITRRFIHINEKNNIVTLLYITMDFEWMYRKTWDENEPNEYAFLAPQYAFGIKSGIVNLDGLCIYDIIKNGIDGLPIVNLSIDVDNSWTFENINRSFDEIINYELFCYGDNFSQSFLVSFFGVDAELYFYATRNIEGRGKKKISLKVSTNIDGTYHIQKVIGSFEPMQDNSVLSAQSNAYQSGAHDYYDTYITSANNLTEIIAKDNNANFLFVFNGNQNDISHYHREIYGISELNYTDGTNGMLYEKIYYHHDRFSQFEIARDVFSINGTYFFVEKTGSEGFEEDKEDNVVGSIIVTAFTLIDICNGVYAYWKITLVDNENLHKLCGYLNRFSQFLYPKMDNYVKWEHYVVTRAGKIKTHTYTYTIPFGIVNVDLTDANLTSRKALSLLYKFRPCTLDFDSSHGWILKWFDFPADKKMDSYFDYMGAMEWLWETASEHGIGPGGVFRNTAAIYSKFKLHPFRKWGGDYKPYRTWPYFKNVGNPGVGYEVFGGSVCREKNYFLQNVLFSKGMEITGINYGFGEYVYTFKNNDESVTVNSPSLDKLVRCTGRNDMILSLE